jgi:dsDNA-binding SOS-regulon protein
MMDTREGCVSMTATTQQAIDIFDSLGDKEQILAFSFLQQLSVLHEAERQEKNAAYLAKIRRGIKQCAEGRGISHELIEDTEDE